MDFTVLGKIGARAHWKYIHHPVREHIERNHNNLKIEKARLLGFLMGDGSVSGKKEGTQLHHDFCFYPDHEKLADLFINDFNLLYLKKPYLRKEKHYFIIRVSSKPAWEDVVKIANFSSLTWDFPKILKSDEERKEWIRAIADCEGHVGKSGITIQSVNQKGLISVQKLLEEFNITSKIYSYKRKNENWNVNYILVISKKDNLKRYKETIGFNHPIKFQKLNNLPACQNG